MLPCGESRRAGKLRESGSSSAQLERASATRRPYEEQGSTSALVPSRLATKTAFDAVFSAIALSIFPILLLYFVYQHHVGYWRLLLKEGGPVETIQAVILVLASISALVVIPRVKIRLHKLVFVAFSLMCIFGCAEEVSWGQHVCHWHAPWFFKHHNDQHETNLHNLQSHRTRTATRMYMFSTFFIYAIVLPWWLEPRLEKSGQSSPEKEPIILPPKVLSLGFLPSSICMFDIPTGREEEIGELFLYMCLFFFTIYENVRHRWGSSLE